MLPLPVEEPESWKNADFCDSRNWKEKAIVTVLKNLEVKLIASRCNAFKKKNLERFQQSFTVDQNITFI